MRRTLSVVALAAVMGCEGASSTPGSARLPTPRDSAAAIPTFTVCTPPALSARGKGFRHKRSSMMALAMSPAHFAQDVIGKPGRRESVQGKFSYGGVGKDLEDEPVTVWLGDCDGWRAIGTATTDDDGRAALSVALPDAPGRYRVAVAADGDATTAEAGLTVLPEQSQVVVFDIDGTLTVSDSEVTRDVADQYFERLYEGDYDPEPYAGGPELTKSWADRGFVIVYLTGRPYWLLETTRTWLVEHGFASGHVHTTDMHRDVLPNVEGVGKFKAAYLKGLQRRGYEVVAAYGNASTDVWAYRQADVPTDRTFIIGPGGGDGDTQPIEGDYVKHVSTLIDGARATQPFSTGSISEN